MPMNKDRQYRYHVHIMRHIRYCALLVGLLLVIPLLRAEVQAPLTSEAILNGLPPLSLSLPDRFPGGVAPPPLFAQLMADPLAAGRRASYIERALRTYHHSPQALMQLAVQLGGVSVVRDHSDLQELQQRQMVAPSPLQDALEMLFATRQMEFLHAADVLASIPEELQADLARMLATIARAEQFRQRAFSALPASVTPALLLEQVISRGLHDFEEPDYRRLLPDVEREALAAGMLDLLSATEQLVGRWRGRTLPAMHLELETPLGRVIIDTTGEDNRYTMDNVLLLIDSGGDDEYEFVESTRHAPLSIIIDLAGNDRYITRAHAAGPASAVLGYAVLWDEAGDDVYEAGDYSLVQGAALFGMAVLHDRRGNDRYHARSHAQGWAFAGTALLLDGAGDDRYHALSQAQAAAGAQAVALLLDAGGNDRYTLAAGPLLFPSAQLPERNVSMGQGAATGLRSDFTDGRSLPGGLAILFDQQGNDRYEAQVFAQGAGYFYGTGLLIDGGGEDMFNGAWYVQAAAAHRGAGLLIKRGEGNDAYHASHSTSLGAAHDSSLAFFLDEAGDDQYRLGDLGLGAAHDNSVALFIDKAGNDRYRVQGKRCLAFGAAHLSRWGDSGESRLNAGLFFDLGGEDHYRSHCSRPANNRHWRATQQYPELNLPSEQGFGFDGSGTLPFLQMPGTRD